MKLCFSAAAVYNQVYSKLSTNQKQSYICKSAIYAHWNGLSKLSTNQKQSFICKSAIVLRRRDTEDTKQYLIKCFRSMTMASLLSMLIETDYNFKKITAVFFGSCLKKIHSVWNCLFIKQNAKLFQHNHLLFEICWGYLFCSIQLSPGCPFHPVVSKSCIQTEFGRTYQTYQIFTVLTYWF